MKDVFSNILPKYLSFKDYKNFSSTCKLYYNQDALNRKKMQTLERINELFPRDIVEMINEKRFLNAVEIPWDDKWLGATEYIDRARPEHFSTNDIFYGVDRYRRPFIFLQLQKDGKRSILCIFQRYTNSQSFVNIDNSSVSYSFFGGQVTMSKEMCENISNLLKQRILVKGDETLECLNC